MLFYTQPLVLQNRTKGKVRRRKQISGLPKLLLLLIQMLQLTIEWTDQYWASSKASAVRHAHAFKLRRIEEQSNGTFKSMANILFSLWACHPLWCAMLHWLPSPLAQLLDRSIHIQKETRAFASLWDKDTSQVVGSNHRPTSRKNPKGTMSEAAINNSSIHKSSRSHI